MKVLVMPVGAYQTNCYLAWGDTDTCVVIDPGYQPADILAQAKEQGKKIGAILLTHGHFDHVGGVREIGEKIGCPVYIAQEELTMDPAYTAGELYYTHTYQPGQLLKVADLTFRVLSTPGHTPGSVCLICGDIMFSGDTLFAGSCGRTDLPGGNWEEIRKSLTMLGKLQEDFHVLPGHGESTTLSQEKRSNPYIKNL